jgi:polar amino acid transport system substrate-binding protein
MVKISPVCLLLFSLMNTIAHSESVVLNANESPPYWSKKLPYNGLGGELISAISAQAGLDSRIEFMPLKRLIQDATNNDLGNPAFYIENQDFAAIIPIAVSQVALYYYDPTHQKKIRFKTLSDLKGYRIGTLSGTLANRTSFEQLGIHFEISYSQESLFKKLQHGRVDMVLEIDLIGKQTIEKLFPNEHDHFVAIELPHSISPIAIMLDKNYPNADAIAQRYRVGLKKIIQTGQYSAIIQRYYGAKKLPPLWLKKLNDFTHLYSQS